MVNYKSLHQAKQTIKQTFQQTLGSAQLDQIDFSLKKQDNNYYHIVNPYYNVDKYTAICSGLAGHWSINMSNEIFEIQQFKNQFISRPACLSFLHNFLSENLYNVYQKNKQVNSIYSWHWFRQFLKPEIQVHDLFE